MLIRKGLQGGKLQINILMIQCPKIGYVFGKGQLVVYDNMRGVYVYDLSSSDLTDYVDFEKIILRDYREMMQHLFMYQKDGRYIQLKVIMKNSYNMIENKTTRNQLDKKAGIKNRTDGGGGHEYYSVRSDVYHIGEGETCFLAINKNVTPNYGALLCEVSNVGAERIFFTLIDA